MDLPTSSVVYARQTFPPGSPIKTVQTESGDKWRAALAAWAIPASILEQAPENPWIHPPALFQIPDTIIDSISHQRAREALPEAGRVLDIGCGGGIAAFALTPPATHVIGVDQQLDMLAMFQANAQVREVNSEIFDGLWPAIADSVPVADVATAHHVVYNVAQIEEFLLAMNSHATSRVVLEAPQQHPLSTSATLWKHFWNFDRPSEPTPSYLISVLAELGIAAHLELWEGVMRRESSLEQLAHYSRIRLCLPADRESEVLEFLIAHPPVATRKLATIWWETQ